MEKQRIRKIVLLMCIGAALLAMALHVGEIGGLLGRVWGMILPAVVGAVMAFVLNVPMRGFERLLGRLNRKKNRLSENKIRFISLWLTLISFVLVIVFVLSLVVPEIAASLKSLFAGIQQAIPDVIAFAKEHIDSEWLKEELLELDSLQEKLSGENITKMIVSISNGAYDIAGTALSIATSTIGSIMSIGMSLIVAIYMLLGKKKLGMQTRKLLYAYLKKEHADKVCDVGRLTSATYAKFLSGQCVEAFIIAILLISMTQILMGAQDLDYATSAEERVECDYKGNDMTIGFNSEYMLEVLANIKGDDVKIELSDPARPGLFSPLEQQEGEDVVMLQMPMQVIE